VSVVPVETDRILADGLSCSWFRGRLEHGEGSGGGFRRFTGSTLSFAPFLVTKGARAGIAEIGKRIVRVVTVFPFDVDAGARREVDFDGFGVGGRHFSVSHTGHGRGSSCRISQIQSTSTQLVTSVIYRFVVLRQKPPACVIMI